MANGQWANEERLVSHIVAAREMMRDPATGMDAHILPLLDSLVEAYAPTSAAHLASVRDDYNGVPDAQGNAPTNKVSPDTLIEILDARVSVLQWEGGGSTFPITTGAAPETGTKP